MNISKNECAICGGNLIQTVNSNSYQYHKCISCATSQLSPLPTENELNSLYIKYHLSDEAGGNYDWIEERMKADFPVKINQIKKIIGKPTFNLLDVGCGKGFFIKFCNDANIDAVGIDVSESGIKYALDKLNVQAFQTDIVKYSEVINNNSKFDAVTLWATIEHLPNPAEVFKAINKCLKPVGYLFIDTGLGNDRFEKFLAGYSQWFDAPQHLFVYSITGLSLLLKQSGFEIKSIDKNFERTFLRRIVKFFRHYFVCVGSFLLLGPILGKTGFETMQKESKWPIGKLIQIIAKKK